METIAIILGAAVAAWLGTSIVSGTNMDAGTKSVINIVILVVALIIVLMAMF